MDFLVEIMCVKWITKQERSEIFTKHLIQMESSVMIVVVLTQMKMLKVMMVCGNIQPKKGLL